MDDPKKRCAMADLIYDLRDRLLKIEHEMNKTVYPYQDYERAPKPLELPTEETVREIPKPQPQKLCYCGRNHHV